MLSEGFAVIAEDDPDRVAIQPARPQPVDQGAERRVSVAKGIAISPELVIIWKHPGRRRFVWMMSGDGQVCEKERPIARHTINPPQHSRDGRRLVDPETRAVIAADIAGVFQSVVAAVADNRFHPEIVEPP